MTARESWWPRKDAARAIARAVALRDRAEPPSAAEISYLRGSVMGILTGGLPVEKSDAERLRGLLPVLEATAEQIAEREEGAR